MSGNVYGSLNGPEIPKTVDRGGRKLGLGKHELKLGKAIEKESKDGQSINVSFPVHSTDEKVKGSAFLRLNFRHKPFQVGAETFGDPFGYLSDDFLLTGLTRLKELSKQPDEVGKAATKELNRANMVLSDIKSLKTWAELPLGGGFAPAELEDKVILGIVRYVDGQNQILTQSYDKATDSYTEKAFKKDASGKTVEIDKDLFDMGTAQAEVSRILFKPKDANADASA